jgi:basic membrane lipoprotein Med (substrate-binding protein (PBP1-ABC) superfamily)
MKLIKVALSTILILSSLTACAATKPEGPTHKARASACLIAPEASVAGSAQQELAYDLVEAKVIYGLNAKEVAVSSASTDTSIDNLLFNSLKAGCVYFIAADSQISNRVVKFAGNHKYVVALIVGGTVPLNQPANVRWVADDLASGAALAGFAAAAKSTTENVELLIQNGYFQETKLINSFSAGVKAFNKAASKNVDLTVFKVSSSAQAKAALDTHNEQVVVAVFAGKAIWKVVKQSQAQLLIGSNLQLGNNTEVDPRVVASVERNLSSVVLNAASDLLDRKFNLDPVLAESDVLANGFIELRPGSDTAFDGATLDLLNAYKNQLLAPKTI